MMTTDEWNDKPTGGPQMTDLSKLVKPLVWWQVEPHIYAAETSAHRYAIFDLDAGPILTRDSLQVASGAMPDLKTFAQADYTARIIAALDLDKVAALEGALDWYREQARLARLIHSEGDAGRHALQADGGKRAAAALAAFKGGEA
jgi:hypothetical protein